MSPIVSLRRHATLAFAVLALAACGDSTAPSTDGPGDGDGNGNGNGGGNPAPVAIARIDVAPVDQGSVLVGWQRQFRATVRAADGSVLTGRAVTWSISHAERGSIDAQGTVTAQQPGLVVVTATSEGRSGTAQLEIVPRTVATLQLSVQALDVALGEEKAVTAQALDAMGQLMHDAPVAWSIEDPAVATVDVGGHVMARRGGETHLVASSGSVTARIPVRVPRTSEYALKGVGNGALPALVDSESSTAPGENMTRRVRWVVTGGTLVLSTMGDDKWTQTLAITVYEDLISDMNGNTIVQTSEVDSFTLVDEGTRGTDAAGLMVFQSSVAGRAPYATRMGLHGGFWITQRPLGYGAQHVLYFAKP